MRFEAEVSMMLWVSCPPQHRLFLSSSYRRLATSNLHSSNPMPLPRSVGDISVGDIIYCCEQAIHGRGSGARVPHAQIKSIRQVWYF